MPPSKRFRIVFEDPHLIVVDKPAGLLTVPVPGTRARNLQDLLDRYLISQKRTARAVHRIDRYTSGLVVFAKGRKAWEGLVAQFRARTPERVYLAVVRGRLEGDEGTLRHRLELTRDGFRQRVVERGGTPAVTHYRVLERFADATLVEVRLETGLKNQIRVQFRAAGHPLVGDQHYAWEEKGRTRLNRQALHAWKLAFQHPVIGAPLSLEAPLPPDLDRLLAGLRRRDGRPPP